ncbi:uncharacterized protein LOC113522143 isoform X2 [Galleria mellonella]|nr:uncharacterized protein LOC113522143 isoform X2 [Galleria mellonella]
MNGIPRRMFWREIKRTKWQRKFSTSTSVANNEFLVKSTLPDIVIPKMSFTERLWIDQANFKNLVALENAETKKTYTYLQLQKYMATFATSLVKKFGLRPGDVVGIMLPNCPEFPVVAFGSLQAGCVVTTINPIYKEFEISHQASITEPKVIVTIQDCYESIVKGLRNAKINAKVIILDEPNQSGIPDGAIRYSEIAENGEADYAMLEKIERKEDDIAFIPFSSGTTGLPKGVELNYRNVLAAMECMQRDENRYSELANGTFQDIVPCILPFYHIYGLIVTLTGHLCTGCKLITVPNFSARLFMNLLKANEVSLLYIVPPIAILLGKHPEVTGEHFRNVRYILCGAAPLAATDAQAILDKSNNRLQFKQGYGATETTSIATTTFKNVDNVDYDACGTAMAGVTLKFVDPQTGNPVPVGEPGEIYIKAPVVMKRYYKNEQATRESMTEDGFFKTGDFGRYKPDAGLIITDRIKELIKVKGLQVAPAELESLLRSHPAVADAAVIGVPHDFYGEVPKALVIPRRDTKVTTEELQNFVASKVAPFKRIEEVVFVDNIPKTSSGKILRKDLKKIYS